MRNRGGYSQSVALMSLYPDAVLRPTVSSSPLDPRLSSRADRVLLSSSRYSYSRPSEPRLTPSLDFRALLPLPASSLPRSSPSSLVVVDYERQWSKPRRLHHVCSYAWISHELLPWHLEAPKRPRSSAAGAPSQLLCGAVEQRLSLRESFRTDPSPLCRSLRASPRLFPSEPLMTSFLDELRG